MICSAPKGVSHATVDSMDVSMSFALLSTSLAAGNISELTIWNSKSEGILQAVLGVLGVLPGRNSIASYQLIKRLSFPHPWPRRGENASRKWSSLLWSKI
ncbi:hypothetical protein ONS95_007867 [Cadophora gregata]|uniref:uncharacterized protein n=1 Tax=Cadophora gregata TaxID=51156 RepID=UPI0026DB99F8|nr:uncharacterized protein ONS95_007867 [Cadophora gregata]KAK0126254.1 hypothetical protein ONS95_007867 [Cadophora gregata]